MQTILPILAASIVLAACSSGDASTSTASSAPSTGAPATASSSASARVASSSAASAAPSAGPKKADAKKADARDVTKHLADGRKLAAKKDWKGAITEYEAALKSAPSDARVLGELGWAALQAGDLAKAKDANKRALASVKNPTQRAQILYNVGRVAEEEKDNDAAKAAYSESLGLRDNKEVAKHLEAVGGKPDEIARAFATCNEGYDTVKDLCGCLVKHAERIMVLGDASARCEADASPPPLGDARLSLVHMRDADGHEDTTVLAATDDKKLRAVAVLGTSYEPGAFGVHNVHTIDSALVKKVGARSIVAVHHTEDDNDSNMGGLELCSTKIVHETLCVLGEKGTPTQCPMDVPLDSASGCGLGVEPEPAEITDDEKEIIKQLKASDKPAVAKTSYTIAEDGKVTVKLESGDASALPPKTVGDFVLFRP
jgi:tetratricopeptide (TPR) repeat protein